MVTEAEMSREKTMMTGTTRVFTLRGHALSARLTGTLVGVVLAIGMIVAPQASAAFGLAAFDGSTDANAAGDAFTQAGGHPYQIATTVKWNSHPKGFLSFPDADIRNVLTETPAGLMANPTPLAQCTDRQLTVTPNESLAPPSEWCPLASIVGTIYVVDAGLNLAVPLYNMRPPAGVPARFGFNILGVTIPLDGAVRGDGVDLHAAVDSKLITQSLPLVGARVVFWGVPADPSHDADRCWGYQFGGSSPGLCAGEPNEIDGPHTAAATPVPFLTLPTSCTEQGVGEEYQVAIDSWPDPGNFVHGSYLTHEAPAAPTPGPQRGTENCSVVPSDPTLTAQPTVKSAESPSGLKVELNVPTDGLLNPTGVAQSHLKKVEVTLPEGMSINPSAADGLGVCTPAQYADERVDSAPTEGCPSTSKMGSVQVTTPLLPRPLAGALYIAQQDDPATTSQGAENPFDSLLALYIVAKDPASGVIVKTPGEVIPDPSSGQLTTVFDELPKAAFSRFVLSFREGQHSPLVSPPACGEYLTTARFTPWSDTDSVIARTSSFEITKGVGGGPCPSGGLPPFKPGLIAGSINNAAGHFSPFNVRLFRQDGEQEITHFSIKLPPGITGKLAGVPFCSDAAIAAAKTKTGTQEEASPSCPKASEVGHTLVGAGVGLVLAYAPGKVYLAGPYNGSALSIAAITAAKVGPFDLGTVVVRQALKIDPETAEVFIDATGSDPIPHIIKGITTHLRDIRAYVDKPEFTLNPTNCTRTSTASTLLGSGLDFASEIDDRPVTVSTPYQAADCAALGFKPALSLKLKGGTKRAGHPALKATLKMKPGMANIARAQVTLPKSEFLDQSHIGTVCTRVQYVKDQCPAASVYGYAKAITPILDEPLQGPVYLRSSEHKLPDLVAGLKSGKIEIDLAGRIDSVDGQIRSTFESVPDAPVSSFTLTMAGGKKGLLENSTNLCAKAHRAIVAFDGQNGKISDSNPIVKPQCSKAKRKAAKRRNAR